MTRILSNSGLAVSAFALLAFAGTPAQAADGIKLGLGGFYTQGFVFVDDDVNTNVNTGARADSDETAFVQNAEVHFKGSTTFDDGTMLGIRVELESNGDNDDTIDEHYVYAKGDWGKLIAGAENGVGHLGEITAPSFVAGQPSYDNSLTDDILEDAYDAALGTNSVEDPHMSTKLENISGDALKVSYFTPRIVGLQLGVSYAPNNRNIYGGDSSYGTSNEGQENIYEVSLNYKAEFEGVDIAVGGSYVDASSRSGGQDPQSFGYGASIGYAGFTVGANYSTYEDLGAVSTKFGGRAFANRRLAHVIDLGDDDAAGGTGTAADSVTRDEYRYTGISSESIETINAAVTYDFGSTVVGVSYTTSEEDVRATRNTYRETVAGNDPTMLTGTATILPAVAAAGTTPAVAEGAPVGVSLSGTEYTEYTVGGSTNLANGVDVGYFYSMTEAEYNGRDAEVSLVGVTLALRF